MKTRSLIASLALLLSFTAAVAQTTTVEGSPYLNETYVSSVVFSGATRQNLSMRYNAFRDLMEYKQNGQAFVLDPSTKIQKVRLGEDTYVVDKYETKAGLKNGFFEILDSGKVTLLSKPVITFQDAKKGGALDGTDLPARYSKAPDTYYLKFAEGETKKVENLKSLIALFPDKNEELTAFAKKEKISVKKEKELIQLIKYYNGLFEE